MEVRPRAQIGTKKAKKSKMPKAITEEESKSITDAINVVCSQQSQESLNDSMSDDNDGNEFESFSDSLPRDAALAACKNLHAEIAKLTGIVQQQRQKIDGLENKLTEVLSIQFLRALQQLDVNS